MESVQSQVNEREENSRNSSGLEREWRRLPVILLGILVYAAGINIFLRPLHLYSGGMMGFAQLADVFLRNTLGLPISFDVSGILYYLFNLPAVIIAFRTMRRRFMVKSLLTITCITLALTIIPIPEEPVLEERIANCLIAGIMGGGGIGLILRMGSCDGGMTLIGMILIQTRGRFSVGGVSMACNFVLYSICMLVFDVSTAIYSLIYSVISSVTSDRVHTQNINVEVIIITKLPDPTPLEVEIMGQMDRGITRWEACGAYTGQPETLLMVIVSKYEITQLRHIVHQLDPQAFVMINEGVGVEGHFLKKIT